MAALLGLGLVMRDSAVGLLGETGTVAMCRCGSSQENDRAPS